MNDVKHVGNCGNLYVVATPIGNMDDITLRALDVLRKVDLIAAEDTRYTGRFLASHDIAVDLISYYDHNEDMRTPMLINRLQKGEAIALLSNAGTPCVSDPGYRLIKTAIENKINVIPIPGEILLPIQTSIHLLFSHSSLRNMAPWLSAIFH